MGVQGSGKGAAVMRGLAGALDVSLRGIPADFQRQRMDGGRPIPQGRLAGLFGDVRGAVPITDRVLLRHPVTLLDPATLLRLVAEPFLLSESRPARALNWDRVIGGPGPQRLAVPSAIHFPCGGTLR